MVLTKLLGSYWFMTNYLVIIKVVVFVNAISLFSVNYWYWFGW